MGSKLVFAMIWSSNGERTASFSVKLKCEVRDYRNYKMCSISALPYYLLCFWYSPHKNLGSFAAACRADATLFFRNR